MRARVTSISFETENYDLEYYISAIPFEDNSSYKHLEITISIKNWLFSTPATWSAVWTPDNEITLNLHKSGPFSITDFALAVVGKIKDQEGDFSYALESCFVPASAY